MISSRVFRARSAISNVSSTHRRMVWSSARASIRSPRPARESSISGCPRARATPGSSFASPRPGRARSTDAYRVSRQRRGRRRSDPDHDAPDGTRSGSRPRDVGTRCRRPQLVRCGHRNRPLPPCSRRPRESRRDGAGPSGRSTRDFGACFPGHSDVPDQPGARPRATRRASRGPRVWPAAQTCRSVRLERSRRTGLLGNQALSAGDARRRPAEGGHQRRSRRAGLVR